MKIVLKIQKQKNRDEYSSRFCVLNLTFNPNKYALEYLSWLTQKYQKATLHFSVNIPDLKNT